MIFADFSSIFWTQFDNVGHSVDGRTKALKNKPVFPSNSISRHAMHSSPTVHWQPWLVLASWESSVRIMMW